MEIKFNKKVTHKIILVQIIIVKPHKIVIK